MDAGVERKILSVLDVLAVEVAAGRREFAEFRDEMLGFRKETGMNFNRVERRLDRIESRLTVVEERRA